MQKKHPLRKFLAALTLVALLTLNLVPPALAVDDTTPSTIIYEGRLLDSAGDPVTVAKTMRFSLWKSADWLVGDTTVGGAINVGSANYGGWFETQSVTPNNNGIFSVELGSSTALPTIIYTDHQFLQVEIKNAADPNTAYELMDTTGDAGADTDDRQTIGSIPYAKNTERLDNHEIGTAEGNVALVGPGGQFTIDQIPAGTNSETFTVDADNTIETAGTGIIGLQFGDSLGKILSYDLDNSYFNFNDNVNIEGDLTVSGDIIGNITGTPNNTFRVDSDAANGYVELAGDAATGNFNLTINNSGLTADLTVTAADLQKLVDLTVDATDLNDAVSKTHDQNTDTETTNNTFRVDSDAANGYVELAGDAATGNFNLTINNGGITADLTVTAADLKKLIDLTVSAADLNDAVSKMHDQNTDTGSDATTFTLDTGDVGGNITLSFGTSLAESLFWDANGGPNTDGAFVFTDDLVVDGDLEVTGSFSGNITDSTSDTFIINSDADDATLQFGQTSNGQIIYTDATSTFDFSGNTITNIADPTNPQDAATRNYVDGLVNGLNWQSPFEHSNQLVDGGAGTGGIRAGGKIFVSDETLVVENDTIAVIYNGGTDTFTLTAKDAPVAANGEFKSGNTATDNVDLASSILDAINAYAFASDFSGQSTSSASSVFLVHYSAGVVGNGTIILSGAGLIKIDMHTGKAFADLLTDETRISRADETTHTWNDDNNAWVTISGANSIPDATTTVKGKVELATDGETAAGVAVQGNDSRLHAQNTDTGTISNTFRVDSDAANGYVELKGDTATGDFNLTINNAGITADLTITAADLKKLADLTVSAAQLNSAVSASHTQNTDTGTTNNTFQVDSDAANGYVQITGNSATGNYNLTINNGGLTADLAITGTNLKKLADITSSAAEIDDAVAKRHIQNTDIGTDNATFRIDTDTSNGFIDLVANAAAGNYNLTINNSGLAASLTLTGADLQKLADLTVSAAQLNSAATNSHTQNTDTGTTNNTFRVDSDATNGYVQLTGNSATGNFNLVINNAGITAGLTVTAANLKKLVDITASAAQINAAVAASHTQNTDTGSTTNLFILNTNDTDADVALKFGTTLNEALSWDRDGGPGADGAFVFSDDLIVSGTLTAGSGAVQLTNAFGNIDGNVIADGTIDDDSLDFGIGADQISALDIPVEDAGSHYNASDVENILMEVGQEIGERTSTGLVSGGTMILNGSTVDIAGGVGYIRYGTTHVRVTWSDIPGYVLPYDGDNFVYIDDTGSVYVDTTLSTTGERIYLGYVYTYLGGTEIGVLDSRPFYIGDFQNRVNSWVDEAVGILVQTGNIVYEGAPNLTLNISGGVIQSRLEQYITSSTTAFNKVYNTADLGWLQDFTHPGYVNTGQFNNTTQTAYTALTGTVTFTNGSPTVSGSGTSFLSEVAMGDHIYFDDDLGIACAMVQSVDSDTAITLMENYPGVGGTGIGRVIKALVNMTPGYWKKDLVIRTVDGEVYYIYAQTQYATEDAAKAADLPALAEPLMKSAVHLAVLVTQQGDTSLANKIYDIRPSLIRLFGFEDTGTLSGTFRDHSNLSGLNDDDHPLYFNIDGSDTMTGDLDLGTNDITGVGNLTFGGILTAGTGGFQLTDITGKLNGGQIADGTINDDSLNFGTGPDQISAADLLVEDVGTHYVATDVEGVLAEIGQETQDRSSTGLVSGGEITDVGGNQIDISAGVGYINFGVSQHLRVTWSDITNYTLPYLGDNFIYIDDTGSVYVTTVLSYTGQRIYLGYVYTILNNTDIATVANRPFLVGNFENRVNSWVDKGVGGLVEDGNIVSEGAPALTLSVSGGTIQSRLSEYTTTSTTNFTKWYNSADLGWKQDFMYVNYADSDQINNTSANAYTALTGTATFTNGSPTVSGSGTSFLSEVAAGNHVYFSSDAFTTNALVQSVDSDTQITLAENYPSAGGTGTGRVDKALVDMTAGYWKKDLVVRALNGGVHYFYGQAQYATEDEAKAAALPVLPDAISNGAIYLAAIVTQQGDTDLNNRVYDIRPNLPRVFGFGTTGTTSGGVATDHGALTGLGDDDHLQYLKIDGARAMTGDFDLGANSITGVNNLTFGGILTAGSGAIQITNATGYLDGSKIANATIGDAAINWGTGAGQVSSADLPFSADTVPTTAVYSGMTSLEETTAANDSGAYIVGVFDEFDNSNGTNVQAVLNDLDAAISGSGHTQNTDTGTTSQTFRVDSDAVNGHVDIIGNSATGDYDLTIDNSGLAADLTITGTNLKKLKDITSSATNIDDAVTKRHTQNTDTGSTADTFTLNTDDTSTDVALKFGTTLVETLTWDTNGGPGFDGAFVFSDDLIISGTITAGSGAIQLTNAAGYLDGSKLIADSVKDGSLDFGMGVDQIGADDLTMTDEFTYSNATNVQDVMDDIDAQLGIVTGAMHTQNTDTGTTNDFRVNSDATNGYIDLVANSATGNYDLTINNSGLAADLIITGTNLKKLADIASSAAAIDAAVSASHTQNTDSGTTNNTFRVDSDATNGYVQLRGDLASGNFDLMIDNSGISANLTVTAANLKKLVDIASSAADIDDAVSKRHTQNTDTGTTSNTFLVDSDATNGYVGFTGNSATGDFDLNINNSGLAADLTVTGTDLKKLVDLTVSAAQLNSAATNSHTQNTDTGTTANAFAVNNDGVDAQVTFGSTVAGYLTYTNATDLFNFQGNLDVDGTITAGSSGIQITNAAGNIDGEQIADGTIDDDSIDWTDVTSSDMTFDAYTVPTTAVYNGTTSLEETTAANDSGASIIGVFDEFTYSNGANVQEVLNDLDAAIAGVGGHTQNTDTGTSSTTFTLDTGDAGGNVTLSFGASLAETLYWDANGGPGADGAFTFTDDLVVSGTINGTTLSTTALDFQGNATIGTNDDTLAINTSDWGITTTGTVTNTLIDGDDNTIQDLAWASLKTRTITIPVTINNNTVLADGSDNSADLYTDSEAGANPHEFYILKSKQASLQDLDIKIKIKLPADFVSFANSGDLSFYYKNTGTNNTDSKIDILVEDNDGDDAFTAADGQGLFNTSWTQYTDEFDGGSFDPAAGEYIYVTIKGYASYDSGYQSPYMGELVFTYTGR